jgi:hypothetical protein
MKPLYGALTAVALCTMATAAQAAYVTIDFDGLKGPWSGSPLEAPGDYYNGGTGSLGSGPGPDYGITFSPLTSSSSDARVICNVQDCSTGNSLFVHGDRFNGTERGTIIHVEGGFRGIVEFDASVSNLNGIVLISAWTTYASGGHLITSVAVRHPDITNDCRRLECEFFHYSFNLADDNQSPDDVVAHAIVIDTFGDDAIFIDNIIFHDLILPDRPVAVAEPSAMLLIGSAGLAGAMLRRRQRAKV